LRIKMNKTGENNFIPGELNVKYPVKDQEDGEGYITGEIKEGSIGLIAIQEWWGLNKSLTITCDKLAAAGGWVVLTPDLYRGKVAKNHEEAGHYLGGLDWPGAVANILSAVHFLKSKGCKKVAVMGFCAGGALTIAACASSQDIDAGIPFYGVPDFKYFNPELIKCPILAHFGEHDKAKGFSDITAKQNLEERLKKGNVKHEIKTWDADHAFMNQDGANYKPDIAKAALDLTVEWIKEQFKN